MRKAKGSGNEILDRVAQIDKRFIEDIDVTTVPTDNEEFLAWWWNTYAKVCQACPLSETRNHVVKPDGNTKARVMIIAEGPGFLEDLTSIPMVGPLDLQSSHCNLCRKVSVCFSHRILSKPFARNTHPAKAVTCEPNYTTKPQLPNKFYIRSAGSILDGILLSKWKFNYPRHNWIKFYNTVHQDQPWQHESPWFITNAVLCRSTDLTGIKDSPPTSVPRGKCKRWLAFQWAAVQPELIMCFGRVALSVLMGSEEAAKSIAPNSFVDTKFGKVLFQNHPAYFMREKSANVKAYGFAKVASTFEKALEYIGLPIE